MISPPPQKPIRILLVEDSPAIVMKIEQLISDAKDYQFQMDNTPLLDEALKLAGQIKYDVALLDLGLPDSDGLLTLDRFRDSHSSIPVVVFTGVDDEENALEALRRGAQDYLVKGKVDGDRLIRSVRYAIERQAADYMLRVSEEKYRSLLQAMPDIAYRIDADGYFTFINNAVARLGYSPSELLGAHFTEILHPADIEDVSREAVLSRFRGQDTGHEGAPKLMDERRTGDRMTRNLVVRLIPKDWKETDNERLLLGLLTSYGEVTASGHYIAEQRSGDNRFVGTVGIIKDITERKRAEEEKESLEAQLQQSQKMEAIGRLAGGVAHDMNNVLGAIQGSASVLDAELPQGVPMREDLENILVACGKGRDLTRDLLGFARKGKYVKQRINLNDVVEQARTLLDRTIPKKVNINIHCPEDVSYVEGDRSQLYHALMNVCINSAAAVGDSGRIEMATRNVHYNELSSGIRSDLQEGEYVEITVRDDGVGMDQATLDKAFEPFFTTKPRGEGTGLGLSMVYGTIKNHGGGVTIASDLGGGTAVSMVLPAVAKPATREESRPVALPSMTPKNHAILLVDDEHIIRTSTRRLLEKLGYTVILAENGQMAVELYKAKQEKISLVILDMIMPVMDGPDTMRALQKVDPRVGVLLLSGYSKDKKIEGLLSCGALGFVQKPFDMATLAESVKKAFAKVGLPSRRPTVLRT